MKQFAVTTPLGSMIAIGDDEVLYLLEFADRKHLPDQIQRVSGCVEGSISHGISKSIKQIQGELDLYFGGELTHFSTPLSPIGTPFQKRVWNELLQIPYGTTLTYKEQAKRLGTPQGYRAVAGANSRNPLAILIPCHRVIASDGKLGGYAGGVSKKEWLLEHER